METVMRDTDQKGRRLHLETVRGSLVGVLYTAPNMRTLDDLNIQSPFLSLHPEQDSGGRTIIVNKSSIVLVQELTEPPVIPHAMVGRFLRCPVHFVAGEFDVMGFVHIPPGGNVIKRLSQGAHRFIGLTAVSVTGPTEPFGAPFLALNTEHILTAEVLDTGTTDEEADLPEAPTSATGS
jgi:hypothetical protein